MHPVFLAASSALLLLSGQTHSTAQAAPAKVGVDVQGAQLSRGVEHYKAGRFTEAAETLRTAASRTPVDPTLHYYLGDTYSALKDYPRAREAYARALSLKPDYPAASNNLAMAMMKSGDFDGGLRMLEKLTDTDPAFALAHYNLGVAYLENDDRHGALRQQMILRTIDPAHAHRLNSRLVQSGRPIRGVPFNARPLTLPAPMMGAAAEKAYGHGVVRVIFTVDPSGSVVRARPLVGEPLLREQAVKAALGSRFTAVLVDGEAAQVTGIIEYSFRRGQAAKVSVPTHVLRP